MVSIDRDNLHSGKQSKSASIISLYWFRAWLSLNKLLRILSQAQDSMTFLYKHEREKARLSDQGSDGKLFKSTRNSVAVLGVIKFPLQLDSLYEAPLRIMER